MVSRSPSPQEPPGALTVLAHRDYRRVWSGQTVAYIGDAMLATAGGWLIARLTDSTAVMGAVRALITVPIVGIVLLAGVLADRYERRKILLTIQPLLSLLALLGAAVVAADRVTLPLVCVWFVLLGSLLAFSAPAKQALPGELLPVGLLPMAVSLQGATFSASQLVGSALAALVLTVAPLHWLFVANSVSYLPLILVLLRLRPRPVAMRLQHPESLTLTEGLRYAWAHREVRALLGTVSLLAVLLFPFSQVFLPFFVMRQLGGSERDLGLVLTGAGLGALVGCLLLTRLTPRVRGGMLVASCAVASLALWGLSLTQERGSATLLVALLGFGVEVSFALVLTLLQVAIPDRLRGRVLGLSEMMVVGVMPLAAIGLGLLADRISLPATMQLASVAFLVPSLVLLLSSRIPGFLPAEDAPRPVEIAPDGP